MEQERRFPQSVRTYIWRLGVHESCLDDHRLFSASVGCLLAVPNRPAHETRALHKVHAFGGLGHDYVQCSIVWLFRLTNRSVASTRSSNHSKSRFNSRTSCDALQNH